jgi:hypothetical protein
MKTMVVGGALFALLGVGLANINCTNSMEEDSSDESADEPTDSIVLFDYGPRVPPPDCWQLCNGKSGDEYALCLEVCLGMDDPADCKEIVARYAKFCDDPNHPPRGYEEAWCEAAEPIAKGYCPSIGIAID